MAARLNGRSQSRSHHENESTRTSDNSNHDDDGLAPFLGTRPRLFGVAYRMLGNAAEAEEVVQDVWVRWQTTDRSVVRDAAAFLVTMTTRLAINVMHSARRRRETCPGTSLPEPADANADAGSGAERHEAMGRAAVILLQKLSATERAAYVLREAFDYPYREIAKMLRLEEANTRQVVTRARHRVAVARHAPLDPAGEPQIVTAFIDAVRRGEITRLADDVRRMAAG